VKERIFFSRTWQTVREWLDTNRVQPSGFRYNFEDTGLVFRVDFAIEAQAVAFAHAFGGELLTGASPARAEAA
jgi:hypothetical protein